MSSWQHIEVELSVTEKTIEGLLANSEYLFCVSVASSKRGNGIRSPATAVHTATESGNCNSYFAVFMFISGFKVQSLFI